MTDSLQVTDAEARAVQVAPRVALADIEAAIQYRFDTTARRALDDVLSAPAPTSADMLPTDTITALGILSICVLVMKNGFILIGKSAPASPANFNAELGKKFAYEDAVRQLWPLMGFALRDRLHEGR